MSLFKFPEYKQHPIALKLMPGGMTKAEFDALKHDIDEHGVLMPVTLFQGMVLDGWHRYRAAKESGCSFKEIEYKGTDPAGYITSVNVLRRKLSSLHRCLVGARLHLEHKLTQRDVCEKLGISNETLSYVLVAIASANVKLVRRLEEDDEFTKGMLREELYDAGLLDAKGAAAKKVEAKRGIANSVFQQGAISAAAAGHGLEDLLAGKTPDTEGSEEDEPDTKGNTGLKAGKAADKKPKASAAQLLSESFKALMLDEQVTFVQMNWKAIQAIAKEVRLLAPVKAELTPIKALVASTKKPARAAAAH